MSPSETHHQPAEGEMFVGLDGFEYEWREGGLVRLGQGFEVETEMTDGPSVEITVTDIEARALAEPTQEAP